MPPLLLIPIVCVTHSAILCCVQGTLDTSGANANTALTKIPRNIKTAGDGQESSLSNLLAAITSLDSNNENRLDGIITNIEGIKSVLELIGASTHARTNLDHQDTDHLITMHRAPQHSFIDEITVNLQPEQTDNQQTEIKADHIVTRHGTLTAAPQYSSINENIVNVQPEQTEIKQETKPLLGLSPMTKATPSLVSPNAVVVSSLALTAMSRFN